VWRGPTPQRSVKSSDSVGGCLFGTVQEERTAVISILGTIMLATIIGIAMLDRASGLTLLQKYYVAPRAGVPRAASSTIRHRAGDPPPPASAV
jgi:hypothetical protein